MTAHKEPLMPWQTLLNHRDRLLANPDLGEGFAHLQHRLGAVTPFELAVLGGRLMATPGLAFLVGYRGGFAHALAQRAAEPRRVMRDGTAQPGGWRTCRPGSPVCA